MVDLLVVLLVCISVKVLLWKIRRAKTKRKHKKIISAPSLPQYVWHRLTASGETSAN